ncbi:hypothetical protein [Burkholderia ambifaria]|uniref:hypothetical protein n=1 Tax=Burkholderia ambifaria TaxID=152480 RepID=UPI00158EFC46|nr:hypothetical protein [Burkholderia ambifaria]
MKSKRIPKSDVSPEHVREAYLESAARETGRAPTPEHAVDGQDDGCRPNRDIKTEKLILTIDSDFEFV